METLKRLKLSVVVLSGLVVGGCVSEQMVNEQLALCPKYFQDNVGETRILPIWSAIIPLTGGPVGWLNKSDGSYSLTALATKDVILHEAFHSVDYCCAENRPDEWKQFVEEFSCKVPKPNIFIYAACFITPFIQDIPVPGYVRLYGCSTGAEDAADCFVFWLRGKERKNDPQLERKCRVVAKFATGQYAKNN